jgi:hypothetical protein
LGLLANIARWRRWRCAAARRPPLVLREGHQLAYAVVAAGDGFCEPPNLGGQRANPCVGNRELFSQSGVVAQKRLVVLP